MIIKSGFEFYYQTNSLNVWNYDVYGLASDIEAVFGVDLEEVGAHEGEDGDAVMQNVLGVGGRGLGQDQKSRRFGVWILTCPS